MSSTTVVLDKDTALEVLEAGRLTRKLRARGGGLMMVEAHFESGALVAGHVHPHEQATYCLEGEFEFVLGDRTVVIGAGDSIYIAPNEGHGARCVRRGRLLDVFTPQREDFLGR